MNPENAPWAFLFLVIVAFVAVLGIVVGMIVAGGLDKLQASRSAPTPEEPTAPGPPADAASDPAESPPQHPVQEDQQP